ncbi:MAG: carbamoyltransferase C-terminal domain-containing protein [Pseudomonadales bacterium]
MRNMLDLFEESRVRATLFTIASDLLQPKKKALIREAVQRGHQLASHSVTHANLQQLDRTAKRREIFDSKAMIEDFSGQAVQGFRAPNYSIDRESFELIDEAGYRFDSSSFPTSKFARLLGVSGLRHEPHRPLQGNDLLELPLPAYAPAPFPFHPSYSLMLGISYFKLGLRRHLEKRVPLTLLFHLIDFSGPLDSGKLSFFQKRFTLSHLPPEAKLTTCREIIGLVKNSYEITSTEVLIEKYALKENEKLTLGVSATHETSAALYRGSECLAAVSEERLDRVKFSTKYPPKKSIAEVIRVSAIDPQSITDVVVAGLPPGKLLKRVLANQWRDTSEFHGWNDYFPHFNRVLYRAFTYWRSLFYRDVLKYLKNEFGISPDIHYVPHHLCHAASAYRSAPFDDALVVTADGVGDETSVSVSVGRAGKLELEHIVPYPHSFGQFYTACTQLLGFRANRHEGKITGLSGYGKLNPELLARVRTTIRSSGADFRLDKRFYSEGIVRGFSLKKIREGQDLFEALSYRNYKKPLAELVEGYSREDVAAVFQHLLEEEMTRLVKPFAEKAGCLNLCLAGGVFANVKLNSHLYSELGFENVYVFPNMGDGGLSSGAALEFLQIPPTPFNNVYWGPDFTDARVQAALDDAASDGISYERPTDLEQCVAELLAEKNVIARFDGRMEFGPRALCNRTILYSAAEKGANQWLNERLGRTEFMPFAPVALERAVDKLFIGANGMEHACRFMTVILGCTDFTKENCPAVVHVDGTARPQLVNEEINPRMTKILECYEALTGVPLLVNTSFNMHEEPIVCTPEDAVRAFLASRLDYLAIGPFLARIATR